MAHAPAKLNLFFEVLGKRTDGFHEIVSLACPVSLYDTLFFESLECSKWKLHLKGSAAGIPADEHNIVLQALEELRAVTGERRGAAITLFKRIPSQAGLGGGSSDAATALLLANRSWNLGLSRVDLAEIGGRIGSDVPLFLVGGASLGRGRGERVEPVPGLTGLHFVLLKPPFGLPTAEVYRDCMAFHEGCIRSPHSFLEAVRGRDLGMIAQYLFNRLEAPASALRPELDALRERLLRHGCLAARMSGSGTALFGLCRSARSAVRIASALREEGLGMCVAVRSVATTCCFQRD